MRKPWWWLWRLNPSQGGVWRMSLGWLLSSVLSSSFISAVVEVEWNAGFQWGCSSASCYDLLSSPVFKEDVSLSAGACSVNKWSRGGRFAEKSSRVA
ncbi:unnamed protein product [Brassica oleracea var. botrytis]